MTEEDQIQNQFQPIKKSYLVILNNLLEDNKNDIEIKNIIKNKLNNKINLSYSAIVQSQSKYLEKYGLYKTTQQEVFYFIQKLLKEKENSFINQVQQGNFIVKSNIKPPPQPQPQPDPQLVQQVESVLNNIDLPLSLFKRNDNYWSIDNPKTKQINHYLKDLHLRDKKAKQEIRKKRQQILKQKQEQSSKTIEYYKKKQQAQKVQRKQKIQSKLQFIKKNAQNRKKSISQSIEYIKERGKPLYEKIQKQFYQKFEIPEVMQKRKRLQQLKKQKQSITLDEINSHKQKYEKIKSDHKSQTIFNQAPKVSYKSHFYQQLSSIGSSRINNQSSNISSLYNKKLEYAQKIRQNFKPSIDPNKKQQIQNRIKIMNKRRVRKNKKDQRQKNSDDQDDEQQEQQQQQQPQPQPQQDQDQQDSDDQDRPKKQKDDQYQPDQKERYKLGLKYLQQARKLAAKKKLDQIRLNNQDQEKTKKAHSILQKPSKQIASSSKSNRKLLNESQLSKQRGPTIFSQYNESGSENKKFIYRNYLQELRKTSTANSNTLNTSRLTKQISRGLQTPLSSRYHNNYDENKNKKSIDIQAEILYQTDFQNKIRQVQQKAKYQQQLLKFKRVKKEQKIDKKMQIDNVMVDTIKARLLMINRKIQK